MMREFLPSISSKTTPCLQWKNRRNRRAIFSFHVGCSKTVILYCGFNFADFGGEEGSEASSLDTNSSGGWVDWECFCRWCCASAPGVPNFLLQLGQGIGFLLE